MLKINQIPKNHVPILITHYSTTNCTEQSKINSTNLSASKSFLVFAFSSSLFSLQTPLPRWLLYLHSHISCTFCEYRNRFSILKLELLLVKTKRRKKNEDGIKASSIFSSLLSNPFDFTNKKSSRATIKHYKVNMRIVHCGHRDSEWSKKE